MYLLTALEIKWVPPRKHGFGTACSERNMTLPSDWYVEGSTLKEHLRLEQFISILCGFSLK